MIVDAHHHVWDLSARRHDWLDDVPALRRTFGLDDYGAVAGPEGITASVLVQVLASTTETGEFLALAAATGSGASPAPSAAGLPVVAGVVGWVDLTVDDVPGELDRLRSGPGGERLVGVRHLVQSEPDPDWLGRPEVRRGLRAVGEAGLVYDLLVRPAQLPAALRVAAQLDETRFVLDHGGKPEIAAGRIEPWAGLLTELAALPNVTGKLSGLVTESGPGWTATDLEPYVDRLLESFGPERLMFGSDWPACTLAASYHDVITLARDLLDTRLSAAERASVFGGTATGVYQLAAAGDVAPDQGDDDGRRPAGRA